MKRSLTITSTLIALLSLPVLADEQHTYTFSAGDNSLATELCLAAVTNDLAATKKKIRSIGLLDGVSSTQRVKNATRNISCNDMNLMTFTAEYGASDTFEYLNKRGVKMYRIDTDEVRIIDLARQKRAALGGHTLVIISSK
ncbi:MAG: DUF3718 domain-containing protein [Thalassotalea sp.]|nr:DUF3718 domain-containing protein [Thalassotalea sp.]MDG2392266.1 DUF3718 domain-containing protein [Thalassotalea sp.]